MSFLRVHSAASRSTSLISVHGTAPLRGAGTFDDILDPADDSIDAPAVATTTAQEATFNLICGGLGTGMFSLPWAMAGASVFPGLLTILCVVAINVFTVVILVQAAERHQAFNLGALLQMLPGRLGTIMQIVTNLAIWFTMILTLIGYIIAIYNSALPLVKHTWLDQGKAPLAGLASLVVLPLCYLDQKYLSCTSILAILANINLLIFVCVLFIQRADSSSLGPDLCLLGFGQGNLTMVGIVTNSIIVQMCILPMYEVLENRSPERFTVVLLSSFGGLALILCVFTTLAYMAVGRSVQGNVLLDLPVSAWGNASQAGVILVIVAVFPIFLLPMVAPLRTMDLSWFVRQEGLLEADARSVVDRERLMKSAVSRRNLFANVATFVIVLVSFMGALVLGQLQLINAINGAVCVGVFSTLVPGLVGYFLLDRESVTWKASMGLLLVFGVVAMIVGLICLQNYNVSLWNNCLWRM